MPILFLDISRLVRRYENYGGPTGMDRVEMAYLTWLWRQRDFTPRVVCRWRDRLLELPLTAAHRVQDTLATRWETGAGALPRHRALPLVRGRQRVALWRLMAAGRTPDAAGAPSVTLNVGHEGLDVPNRYADLPGAFAVLLSDLIPLTHPEYDTPRATALHARRLATIAARADLVLANSAATRDELLVRVPRPRFCTAVAHLGPALSGRAAEAGTAGTQPPTFVHLSSINRRKNLVLLLHVWRELVRRGPAPRLVIIGQRGNDGTALELIDRCAALRGTVRVLGTVSDAEAARHLAQARALLTPSFAEGFGLPIAEAHALGVPVVASDIPAHREVGGTAAIYLSPLDGPGWAQTITRLAFDDAFHARRVAAIKPPFTWDDHFAIAARHLAAAAH